jgi:hypothetical protein
VVKLFKIRPNGSITLLELFDVGVGIFKFRQSLLGLTLKKILLGFRILEQLRDFLSFSLQLILSLNQLLLEILELGYQVRIFLLDDKDN